jgi:2-C-methyl-D-erythritol 2,4-cyclodiphosphate synthase
MELRIGQGIDIHPFAEGRKCVLGGIEIPGAARGLQGHSDADALLHALIDALLGAMGERDIGTLFPDDDQSFKGIDSSLLLAKVWDIATSAGWSLVNADMTLLAEVPRVKPYVQAMREKMAGILTSDPSRITVKATTTEKLGFIGREEGVLASCVVLLQRA